MERDALADDELRATLGRLADLIESERSGNARFRVEVRERSANTEKRLDGIDGKLIGIDIRLDGIDKRLDDQSHMLAALIPAKIAAVGR